MKKIGHLGTLDPAASGVLVLAVGAATKLVEFLIHAPKIYQAEIEFGCTSDTLDLAGQIQIKPNVKPFTAAALKQILPAFTGAIYQTPPKFSALKIRGQPAYKRARQGEKFQIKPRLVQISTLTLEKFTWPHAQLKIACSSGTYIRSLARDLGQRLQTGALLSKLVRLQVGNFTLAAAITPPQITAAKILPLTTGLTLPQINLTPAEVQKIQLGQKIPAKNPQAPILAGVNAQHLIAILQFEPNQKLLAPKKVFPKN